ncbi:hypothetical protein SIAM614_11023 [Stappia aggregata IAM 12614]|uniref:Uncharacterized protein n=1 Tax=Roseibium aggregatum (strain ATCC 25650 / DSM 13394 / JCM 20685 / NBRC 16684 / NCIMB 2208 / IAM 12614 / B1) TaxID=384765 RepID=A0NMR2_ROSAI|nr:hypothetical protein SIAM614_11023 [Stappia aggregata IAM 12614] [Roseibium aggregatum IAM 12614]
MHKRLFRARQEKLVQNQGLSNRMLDLLPL